MTDPPLTDQTHPAPPLAEQPSGPWKATEPDDPTRTPTVGRYQVRPDQQLPPGDDLPTPGRTGDLGRARAALDRAIAAQSTNAGPLVGGSPITPAARLPMPLAGRHPEDSGVHTRPGLGATYAGDLTTPTPADASPRCPHCGSPMPATHELLSDVLTWIDGTPATEAVHQFYVRLFDAAPDLRVLFPDEIKIQEEKLLAGVVSLFHLFQAGDDQMEQLDAELARYGRGHTRFDPPATIEEYAAVKTALLGVLSDMLGARLTRPHLDAVTRAYEYAAGMMLAAQATARLVGTGRRRRTV